MDAAVDIRATYDSVESYGVAPKVWVRVDDVGPFRLRFDHTMRVAVEPGAHVVAVWASSWMQSQAGLAHAVLDLEPGRTVGLLWRLPRVGFGSSTMVAGRMGQPGGYAPLERASVPAGAGPCLITAPHGSEPLVPVVPNPPYTMGLAEPPVPPIAPRPAPGGAWHPDPAGHFAHRWWDGVRWTEAVSDGVATWADPI